MIFRVTFPFTQVIVLFLAIGLGVAVTFLAAVGDGETVATGDLLAEVAVEVSDGAEATGLAAVGVGVADGVVFGVGVTEISGTGEALGVGVAVGVGEVCTLGSADPPIGAEVPPEIGALAVEPVDLSD